MKEKNKERNNSNLSQVKLFKVQIWNKIKQILKNTMNNKK